MIPLHDDNPTESFSYLTVGLIVLNVLVFFYELSLPQGELAGAFFMQYAAIPALIVEPPALTVYGSLFTSMFLHGGWMHLIGNMLYLWIFGNNIEDSTGRIKFILFYLLCGLAASGAHILSAPMSRVPCVGASGAISGILGAYLLLYPRARVMCLVPIGSFSRIVYLPAWLMLIMWFVMQLFSGWSTLGGDEGGGVAWWAHIGGFVAGLGLIGIFKKRGRRMWA